MIFKNVSDNKTSWKTVQFFLSEKLVSTKKTHFTRQQEHHFNRLSDSCCFGYFLFSDFTKPYVLYPMPNDFSVSSIKSIVKYRNHTSTLEIGEVFNRRHQSCPSSKRDKKGSFLQIYDLNLSKTSQDTDRLTKKILFKTSRHNSSL